MSDLTSTSTADNNTLSLENARAIVRKHSDSGDKVVVTVEEIKRYGFSYTAGFKVYVVDLESKDKKSHSSCFISIATSPENKSNEDYHTNNLHIVHSLLATVRSKTEIPINDSILDTSQDIISFPYLLSPPSPFASSDIISLREAKQQGHLSPQDTLLVDLLLGRFLAQLHTNVQNDWYGIPTPPTAPPTDPSYSWQETFTLLFETLLGQVQELGYTDLPYGEMQRHMSRAIAFFLFDDVEVPSLIWLTGSEDDIYISLPSHPGTKPPSIAAIIPSLSHALWGDPLLETLFMDLKSAPAVLEGYKGSGGGPLLSFPRQKTKRIWYTIFLALLVLSESGSSAEGGSGGDALSAERAENKAWARKTIVENAELLKDSPCY
ncbi:hypothetical protein FA15DRAFT_648175 [Coprinopsis marcescibilis]|uniref:Aminoglycoside phosphotransferase domain-containing protein n=1 Tax=Coprinopsis marcescibilis TaxID=230819 RepID=A0A5C3KIB5_COPMA|nr:hypothetical protein FA15DRAFT_648175 [Coprinopsis marcescibilis]